MTSYRPRRPRPVVELSRPRLSVLHVLNRVRMRLLDIQVWDVAGTMTFYLLLSIFPGAVAVVSMMSLIGIERETLSALSGMITEIFPTLDPRPFNHLQNKHLTKLPFPCGSSLRKAPSFAL